MGSAYLKEPTTLVEKMNQKHVDFFCLLPSPTFCPTVSLLDLTLTAVPRPSMEMCLEGASCSVVGDYALCNHQSGASC